MKRRKWRRLQYQDRKKIEELIRRGRKVDYIAEIVGFNRATIYKELKRCDGLYNADDAQKNIK